jgi:ubiquinone biosynthesis protein
MPGKTGRRQSLARYRQILAAFTRQGFGYLIDQTGLLDYLQIRRQKVQQRPAEQQWRYSTGARLRLALEELGPTFIKVGQILSTRPDLFPDEVIKELRKLQDAAPPFPFEEVAAILEEEFADSVSHIFAEFTEQPVASASLAQVHRARLKSGRVVAVKVQRPGVQKTIDADLDILKDVAGFLDQHTRFGELFHFQDIVQDFDESIHSELDFTQEADNIDAFRRNLARDPGVAVPEVNWIYTTPRVLTMSYVDGIRIDDLPALEQAGLSRMDLARRLATSICNQVFRDGLFHADPHPGNLQVLPDGTLIFLDLGMVGRLSETRKEMVTQFFIGVTSRNSRLVVKSLVNLEGQTHLSHYRQFEHDVGRIIDKYLEKPWKDIHLDDLFRDTFTCAYRNHVVIPREYAVLAKTFGTLEGLLVVLAPEMNTFEVIAPIARRLVRQSFTPRSLSQRLIRSFWSQSDQLADLPKSLLHLFNRLGYDDFRIQFDIKDMHRLQDHLDRAFNRVAFSVMLLATSIIIAGVTLGASISAGANSRLVQLNQVMLQAGLVLAGVLFTGLMISVIRSTRR